MGNEFQTGDEAAVYLLQNKELIKPSKANAIMWGAYMNLYQDRLEGFSIINSESHVYGKIIPALTIWRIVSAISKVLIEIFHDNGTTLTKSQKIRFFMLRVKSLLKSKWIQ